jgi:hypothetical protein
LLTALLATFSAAAPGASVISRNTQCPGMSHLDVSVKCPSGFVGCAPYEMASKICNGPKRFYNDCSASPGLGSFYRCNGFVGCTTNQAICSPGNNKTPTTTSTASSSTASGTPGQKKPNKWSCPAGAWYVGPGACTSRFVGCTVDSPTYCLGPKRFWSTCPPNHGTYYVCANGFVGCTTNSRICG